MTSLLLLAALTCAAAIPVIAGGFLLSLVLRNNHNKTP